MARRGPTGQTVSQAPQPLHFAGSTSGSLEKPPSALWMASAA